MSLRGALKSAIRRRSNLYLIPASSILLALAFSSFNLSLFIWFGLVPLFFAIEARDRKKAFLISYICGFLFFLMSMYWLVLVTPVGWVALSLYQALYFGIFGLFFSSAHSRKYLSYFILPSIWCVLEFIRAHLGGGIGWNLLGYAEYRNIPIIQIADITGVYGVSFLIILLNYALFMIIKMGIKCQKMHQGRLFAKSTISFKQEIKINPFFQSFMVLFIFIGVINYGQKRMETLNKKMPEHEIKASVVQGNIQQMYKWNPAYRYHIMEKYEDLTLEAAKDSPDIIIWPETSVPGYLNDETELKSYINDMARISMSMLLVGAPTVKIAGRRDLNEYNSAMLFSKDGTLVKQYDKLRLVLFGEYIPLERFFPFLRKLLPLTGNFSPGREYTIFTLPVDRRKPEADFGVLICFEDIFPGLVRRFVKEGADFMVNITNDAWFGRTQAAYQHAANSVFRAVENRRSFIRSANTGFSCFIDRIGRIYAKVSSGKRDIFVDGYETAFLRYAPGESLTFYTRFGDVFVLICLTMTGFFLFDYLRRQLYNK